MGPSRLAPVYLLFSIAIGCGQRNTYVPPPPPLVTVATPQQREVTVYHEYTGTTQASQAVDIRARAQGYLESIHFADGSTVAKDQLLFVIDPRPYAVQLDQAKAELESRKATVVQQESIYKRAQKLLPSGAVSPEEVEINRGNYLVAKAGVTQAEATVRQAELNLGYTKVTAPMAGRMGRRMIDLGNLVTANVTLLATLTQYDPMYAYFNVSEANYLAYLKRQRAQEVRAPKTAKPETRRRTTVELGLSNETGYPHRGYIDFASPTIDPSTGTRLVRGVFSNSEPYQLVPGFFVRLRVPIDTQPNALLVPESALGSDQAGRFLLIVRSDNTVEHRPVLVGTQVDSMRVIEEGLQPNERFVVEGLQRARPGSTVAVKE